MNHANELELISPFGTKIAVESIMVVDLVSDHVIPFGAAVDVVFIMDCCYPNHLVTHAHPGYRRVDILAAGDGRDPVASGSQQALSFTSKIHMDLQERARQGTREVEMAQLITNLRGDGESQTEAPIYLPKLGLGSVTLPIVQVTPRDC